jgi:hypothetical protein
MRRTPRRVALILVVLCFVPSMSAAPEWMSDLIDETWNHQELQEWADEEAELSDDLDEKIEIVTARLLHKEAIYLGIESGRVSLSDAVRQFREIGVYNPADGGGLAEPPRVGSEDEIVALIVIRGVRNRIADAHPSLADIAERFDAEFEHQYGYRPPLHIRSVYPATTARGHE